MTTSNEVITLDHPSYPRRLAGVAKGAPSALFCRGPLAEAPLAIAIVGSRAASGHAMASARSLARELGARGALIVSGGAIGIDSAAHRGALEAGAKTVAVLANGLDAPYPERNRPLFSEILSRGGALVSPYPDGSPPKPYHFVKRNSIIAGMVDAVIVACAQLSSGALHTAAAAAEYGRVVAALPGTPGCEGLIAQGAAVVETVADLDDALAGRPRRPQLSWEYLGDQEMIVFEALDFEPLQADNIAIKTGLAARDVTRALTGLELGGFALALPGRNFVRSALSAEALVR